MFQWLQITFGVLSLLWFFVLRPRHGGKDEPPLVTSSPVVPIPLIGHIIEFFKSPNDMITRCYHDYGPIFTIPLFFKRLTYLVGPTTQEAFFKASDDVMSQQEVYGFMTAVFGPNVVYDASKKNRQVQFQSMANGLRGTRMKSYVHKIEEETRNYLKQYWNKPEGTVDLLESLSELTILTASRCLHGEDVRMHMFKELQQLYHDLDMGLTPLTVFWPHAPTQRHKKRDEAREQLIALFEKVINERRKHPENSDGTDILSIFMDIKYKDGTPITTQEITGLLIALLFAGQHTSCVTSTWTSLFIQNDKDVIKKLRDEQEEIFGSKEAMMSEKLDYEKVMSMNYAHNCMREALRMCPTFIMILRHARKNIPVKSENSKTYVIPEGDQVVVSPTVSMRIKTTFPNPNTYDPDRFSPGRDEHKIPYAYLGFGGGMHSCMGEKFAFLQVKIIISILFREYEIERIEPGLPDIGYDDMVVGPKGDCRIRYKKRSI